MIQETLTVGALPPVRAQLLGDVHIMAPLHPTTPSRLLILAASRPRPFGRPQPRGTLVPAVKAGPGTRLLIGRLEMVGCVTLPTRSSADPVDAACLIPGPCWRSRLF